MSWTTTTGEYANQGHDHYKYAREHHRHYNPENDDESGKGEYRNTLVRGSPARSAV
jgi:hypothetical protein